MIANRNLSIGNDALSESQSTSQNKESRCLVYLGVEAADAAGHGGPPHVLGVVELDEAPRRRLEEPLDGGARHHRLRDDLLAPPVQPVHGRRLLVRAHVAAQRQDLKQLVITRPRRARMLLFWVTTADIQGGQKRKVKCPWSTAIHALSYCGGEA